MQGHLTADPGFHCTAYLEGGPFSDGYFRDFGKMYTYAHGNGHADWTRWYNDGHNFNIRIVVCLDQDVEYSPYV
ncbi:hypothetical protein ACFC1T_36480 [Kitasatospora sp. NPDC056076]|uniref:hypothetical protein n=1 Tax=Kitasatospora sp. NPDC056076 TaxID=3345703 RepID=UPI0035DECEEB